MHITMNISSLKRVWSLLKIPQKPFLFPLSTRIVTIYFLHPCRLELGKGKAGNQDARGKGVSRTLRMVIGSQSSESSFLVVGGIWGTGGEPKGAKVFLPGFRTLKVLTAEESSG